MTDITKSSGNVYEDLGYADAEEMHVKAGLASKISDIIRQRQLTQVQASAILGMPQPKLSGMLRGQFRGISEARMMDCLNRLGVDVDIIIHDPNAHDGPGHTRVLIA